MDEQLKAFTLKSGTKQGAPLLPLLFSTVLGTLARAVRQETEIKGQEVERKMYNCLYLQMT